MEAGTALVGRRLLALFVVVMLMASVMLLLSEVPARANHVPDDTVEHVEGPSPTGTNHPAFWEQYLATERGITDANCSKIDENDDEAWVMPAEPVGEDWVLLAVKQGDTNFVYYDPEPDHAYPSIGENAPGYSHIIVCSVEEEPLNLRLVKEWDGDEVDMEDVDLILLIDDTPIEPLAEVEVQEGDVHEIREVVTGLPEDCTYTSNPETPFDYTVDPEDAVDGLITLTITNTVDCQETTTTTTVPETTTTTIEDEVLPTVITTSTTLATTTTTVEDEVLDTEVLPFTGGDNDMLALLAGSLGLLGTLVLASTRRMEDN